jgi:hypothetical protein
MDPRIDFLDIESPSLRQQVQDLMEELVMLCPSDSAVRATFRRIQGGFLADIKVASESVYMAVWDQTAGIAELLEHVEAQLMHQIIDWRSHRFAS